MAIIEGWNDFDMLKADGSVGDTGEFCLAIFENNVLQSYLADDIPIYTTGSRFESCLLINVGAPPWHYLRIEWKPPNGDTWTTAATIEMTASNYKYIFTESLIPSPYTNGRIRFSVYLPNHWAWTSKSFSIYLAREFKPSVSVSLSAVNDFNGHLLKGVSSVKVKAIGVASQGATISRYLFAGTDMPTKDISTSDNVVEETSGVLTKSGTAGYKVRMWDSRNQQAFGESYITVTNYEYPTVYVSAERCNADETLNPVGDYIKVTVGGYVYPINGGNGWKTIRVRVVSPMSMFEQHMDASTYSPGDYSKSFVVPLNVSEGATVTAWVTDQASNTAIEASCTVPVGFVTLDFLDGGKGVSVGTSISQDMLNRLGAQSLLYSEMQKNVFGGGVSAGYRELASYYETAKLIGNRTGEVEVSDVNGESVVLTMDVNSDINTIDSYDDQNARTGRVTIPRDQDINLGDIYGFVKVLPTGTDIRSVINPGYYYCSGSNTYTNMPDGVTYGFLEVLRNGTGSVRAHRMMSGLRMYQEWSSDSGSTWSGWVEFVRSSDLSDYWKWLGVLPSGTSINTLKVPGRYYCNRGWTYTGLPEGEYGHLEVLVSGNDIVQRLSSEATMYIRRTGNNGNVWTAWQEIASMNTLNGLMYSWNGTLATDTNINTVLAPGRYYCNRGWTYTNLPSGVTDGHLEVLRNGTVGRHIVQRVSSGIRLFQRESLNTGSVWTAWTEFTNGSSEKITEIQTKGIALNARKSGPMVWLYISGTPSETLNIGSTYEVLGTLPEGWRPSYTITDRDLVTRTKHGVVEIMSSGQVRLGYTGYLDGSGGVVPQELSTSESIYLTTSFMV